MDSFKVQKGKVGTRGQKQILKENAETLKLYFYMTCGATITYLAIGLLLFNEYSTTDVVLYIISTIILLGSYRFMSYMATPTLGERGEILDEGSDLNIQDGLAEHIKDLIILTSGTVVLSTISSYFWCLGFLGPLQVFRLLWVNIISPWIFQEPPSEEEDERTQKKRRKMERRMKYQ